MSSLLTTMAEIIGRPAATSSSLMRPRTLPTCGTEMRIVHIDAEHLRELAVVDELARAGSLNKSLADRLVVHGQLLPSAEIILDAVKRSLHEEVVTQA